MDKNEKCKVVLGLKSHRDFSTRERQLIIEEYLESDCTKRQIWKKYTGQNEEKGNLLKWIRKLGYLEKYIDKKVKDLKSVANKNNKSSAKSKNDNEAIQLKEKIAELEKALVNSELRATALETMITVAEKDLKINIRKKSYTKQSIK